MNLREWLESAAANPVSPGPLIGGLMPSDRTLREFVEPEPNTVYGDILPLARPEDGTWRDIRPAVPGMLRDFARAVRFPYDYAHSDVDPTSPEVVTRATETALSLMGGGAFMRAPANSLRMFAGRNAKTADLGALERAQMMEANGLDRDAIWSETGWFKGVDGQWRFEIDDSKVVYDPEALADLRDTAKVEGRPFDWRNDTVPVGGVMDHPQLYAAYPDMADMAARFAPPDVMKNAKAAYSPSHDAVTFNETNPAETMRSFGLHELQHGVQKREGFSPGTTTRAGMENYRLSAGEVEARNVAARANMTPEERRVTPPWRTQDTPDADQIIRRDYTGPAASYPADAPLRAPELPAATTPAEQQARDILEMLRSGRASEITDEMMAKADPAYLFDHYDLPMDEASRMARAKEMGFDTDTPLYHGTTKDFASFDAKIKPRQAEDPGLMGRAVYLTEDKKLADLYSSMNWKNEDLGAQHYPVFSSLKSPFVVEDGRTPFGPGISEYHPKVVSKDGGDAWRKSVVEAGHDGANFLQGEMVQQQIVFDPANIRSRFARFDPRLSHLRNLNAANAAPEMALLPGAGEALRPELAAAQEDPMEAEIRRYLEAVMREDAE